VRLSARVSACGARERGKEYFFLTYHFKGTLQCPYFSLLWRHATLWISQAAEATQTRACPEKQDIHDPAYLYSIGNGIFSVQYERIREPLPDQRRPAG
ncbi:MAG: hypothetical protein WAV84_14630, partial [Bacteroidota bacterium]